MDTALARRIPAFEQNDAALLVDDVGDLDAGKALLYSGEHGLIIAVEFSPVSNCFRSIAISVPDPPYPCCGSYPPEY